MGKITDKKLERNIKLTPLNIHSKMNDYTNSFQGKGFLPPSHEDISSDHSQISSGVVARN